MLTLRVWGAAAGALTDEGREAQPVIKATVATDKAIFKNFMASFLGNLWFLKWRTCDAHRRRSVFPRLQGLQPMRLVARGRVCGIALVGGKHISATCRLGAGLILSVWPKPEQARRLGPGLSVLASTIRVFKNPRPSSLALWSP
jgi:hypothetical protein